MNKFRSVVFQFPVTFAILVMIVAAALTEIHFEDRLAPYWGIQSASYLTGMLSNRAESASCW